MRQYIPRVVRVATLGLFLLVSLPAHIDAQLALPRSTEPSAPDHGTSEISLMALQIPFCIVLLFLYITHTIVVFNKRKSMHKLENRDGRLFKSYIPTSFSDPDRWTFIVTTIALPVGVYLVSELFSSDGIRNNTTGVPALAAPRAAYSFSMSVFIIMIALEVSYISNLIKHDWRQLLTGALALDLVSFLGYSLMERPSPADYPALNEFQRSVIVSSVFFLVTGVASLVSSLVTLYSARTYEVFALAGSEAFKVRERQDSDKAQDGDRVQDSIENTEEK